MNRLKGSSLSGGAGTSTSFAYDAVGNLTSKSDVGTYSYPAAASAQPHAVQSITGTVNDGAGATGQITNPSYQYDANGNMIKGGGRTISYTAANLPATISNGESLDNFFYDGEHRRYKEAAQNWTYISMPGSGLGFPIPTSNNGTQIYIQTAQGIIAYATIAPNNTVSWTSYFGTAKETKGVYRVANGVGTYSYYHHDHLGSLTAITNAAGSIVEQDSYDAWGKLRTITGGSDSADSLTSAALFTYTGQENLAKVALLHYNARTYDPQVGKFMGSDPITGNPYSTQGWNRYAYTENNPLNSIDPTGLAVTCTVEIYTAIYTDKYGNIQDLGTTTRSLGCTGDSSAGLTVAANILDPKNFIQPTAAQRAAQQPGSQTKNTPQSKPVMRKDCSIVQNKRTGGPLLQPSGVSLSANAAIGLEIGTWSSPAAEGAMVAMFAPGGTMDYQRSYGTGGLINRTYIDFGNYNYGVVAAAAGFPYTEALIGAGLANQLGSGDNSGVYGNNPRNLPFIQQGYDDYTNGQIGDSGGSCAVPGS